MRLYEELETGIECERLAPTLQALAQGTADSEALLELRPHLRNCAGCRATVRALHASHLRRLTAFAPIAAIVAPARAFVERLRGGGGPRADQPLELHPIERQDEVDELFRRLNGSEAAVQPVAPSVAEGVGRLSTARLNVRGWAEAALQRLQSSDLVIGVHAASTGGGGRITSIAALIGICVSGVGAGTYCVATALLPDPKPAVRSEAKTAKQDTSADRRARKTDAEPTPSGPLSNITQRRADSDSPTSSARTQESERRQTGRAKSARRDEFSFETGGTQTASQASSPASATSATAGQTPSSGGFETGTSVGGTSGGEFDDGAGGEFSP